MKTNYNVKLAVFALTIICMLIPFTGVAQSVVVSLPFDNCMNPLPNAGTYTASGTMNGKNMYVKGANLRIVWTGSQWEIQGDDPGIGGVSWYAGWVNTKNTTTPPADCWTSPAGCFLPTLSGPDAFPVVTATITAVDPSPTGNAVVNYTATFSGTMNSLTTSNFSLNTSGVTGASVSSVTQTSGTVWNIAVGTGSGNGTIQLSLNNTTGASATLCTLPKNGPTYTINHNTAPVFVSSSPQTLSVCQNASATSIVSLLHVNDVDASQTETWSQSSAPSNGTLTFSSATAASGSTNITPGGTITYTPNAGYTGSDAFTVQVSDGTATALMTINVTVNSIPTVSSTTPASRCGTGTVTLGATASAGTLNWYAASTGGSSLGTGTSFTTPSISATTTYYVDATNSGCTSARTAVVATVNITPTITGTTPASRCGTGTVTLGATASAGTLNWYAASTGGSSLGTGTSFTTPNISTTTTYYVDATNSGCTSTRTAVVATVNTIPTITGTTPGSRCGTGTVTLGATASAGTLNWYAASTGGSSLGTGTSFTTPSISTTTTYYVDATSSGCTSARTAVVATVNTIPTITGTTPGSRCGTGTVTLGATASAGTLNWYAAPTGGSSLGTGTSFATPSINTSTTYYVDATNSGCTSARTEVVATVNFNPVPTISASGTTTFCNGDSVMLTANSGGNALTFDGSNDYVDCGSGIGSVFGGTNKITVEAWVNTSSGQNLQTIAGNYNGPMQFLLRLDGMKPVFWVSNGSFSNATGATTIPQNTWVHIAGTWDGTMIKVYYNGVLDGSNPYGGSLPSNTNSLRIGASLLTEMFSGSIDEVRIWNIAKTQAEIQGSINTGVAANASNLVAYYKLNEGTGTTTADASANANNGTLINGPSWMVPSTSPVDAVTYLWSPNGETTKTIAAKTSGNYSVTLTSTQGCSGSSSPVAITVNNATAGDTNVIACNNFTWYGNTYSSSGTATHTFTNSNGCDSIVTLHLTIDSNLPPAVSASGATTFCNGDSVMLTANSGGNALTFDGSNDYVDCGSGMNSVFAGTNKITVEAWVNTSSGQNLQTIAGNYNGPMQFLLRLDGMKPVFWVSNGSFSNATGLTTVPQNTWVHIAGTWDGTTIRVYYNGVLDGSNPYSGNLPSVTQPVRIGASLLTEMFSGSIDEVRFWNVAKTQTEIQSSMNAGVGSNAAGLVGYYKLNEGTGTTTAEATVNANTGTLINGPTWMVPSTSPVDAVTYLWSPNGETTQTIAAKTSGSYSVTMVNTNGCSVSSAGTNVTVINNTISTDVQTACNSFTWMDGNTYTASNNTATYTIPNVQGCDSIITLNLTIKNNSSSNDVQTACESFTWMDGNTYTASNNTATYTIPNAAGCDSTITLDLTIKNSSSSTDVQSACDSFTWMDGNTYTSSTNTATHTIPNAAGCDSIITLNLVITNSTSSTLNETACNSYTLNGTTYTATGSYTQTTTNAAGCDSTITLNLTINTVDVSVSAANETITAIAAGATYQWLDCNSAFSAISNEINQSFTASANGDYAVEVTQNGCTDTSACTPVMTVSIEDVGRADLVGVYPNPADDNLNIEFNLSSATQSLITIVNAAGQLMFMESVSLEAGRKTLHYSVKEFARGIYCVRITNSGGVIVKRIVLQ